MPGLLSPIVKLDPPPAEVTPMAQERRHGEYARRKPSPDRQVGVIEFLAVVFGLIAVLACIAEVLA